MYTAKIQNANGEMLTLTQNESEFQLYDITGIDQPTAAINFTTIAGMDGSKFNSATLNNRNIVIYIRLNGDVERNRHLLYRMFRTKESCTFYYTNDTVDAYIEGYVESVSCPIFTNSEIMQVSILCPYPYFTSIDTIIADITNKKALFTFPFSINANAPVPISEYIDNNIIKVVNDSQNQLGMIINIKIRDDAPSLGVGNIVITNTVTQEYIKMTNSSWVAGDTIRINTRPGQKSILEYYGGSYHKGFLHLDPDSTFLQLDVGDNFFSYSAGTDGADTEYVDISFTYAYEYRGV